MNKSSRISHNLHRRHLTESQRASIAARVESMKHGGNRQDANLHLDPRVTRAEAATLLNVSERSVASARKVHETAPPEIVRAEDARKGLARVSDGEAGAIEGWLAYGAALNEGRALFHPEDDKGFGQGIRVGNSQLPD
ncbi:MAG: hypothetical protein CVT75_09725 [Alphaproteobacteria bacterium HGW-Alphaproteobacteria-14]|nr:MAG: hypothetical protein CVT75_09725 [Alphaproteobacteria bacterium HGW-Alphaproteobacteria-14]